MLLHVNDMNKIVIQCYYPLSYYPLSYYALLYIRC